MAEKNKPEVVAIPLPTFESKANLTQLPEGGQSKNYLSAQDFNNLAQAVVDVSRQSNDNDQKITTLNGTISSIQTELSNKVDNSTYTAKVNELDSEIKANKSDLATAKTDISTLKTDVAANKASISQVNDVLNSKVAKTTYQAEQKVQDDNIKKNHDFIDKKLNYVNVFASNAKSGLDIKPSTIADNDKDDQHYTDRRNTFDIDFDYTKNEPLNNDLNAKVNDILLYNSNDDIDNDAAAKDEVGTF